MGGVIPPFPWGGSFEPPFSLGGVSLRIMGVRHVANFRGIRKIPGRRPEARASARRAHHLASAKFDHTPSPAKAALCSPALRAPAPSWRRDDGSRFPLVTGHLAAAGCQLRQNLPNRAATTERILEGAPALAIEVASESNTAAQLDLKMELYFAHGAEEVWIVYPTNPARPRAFPGWSQRNAR